MNMEIDEDLTNLTDLLDKMPNMISALNATVLEMQLGSTPGEDYEEKKEEIKSMRANMKSASWVSALYGALVDPIDEEEDEVELSGSK